MRPIDADELKNSVLKWLPLDPCGQEEKEYPFETDICVSVMQEIEDAPTIEPGWKKGKWIVYYECSKCGEITKNFMEYCPFCGADMR